MGTMDLIWGSHDMGWVDLIKRSRRICEIVGEEGAEDVGGPHRGVQHHYMAATMPQLAKVVYQVLP
jgi:hypothetical protein